MLSLAVAVAPNHKSETMMAKRAGWMILGAMALLGILWHGGEAVGFRGVLAGRRLTVSSGGYAWHAKPYRCVRGLFAPSRLPARRLHRAWAGDAGVHHKREASRRNLSVDFSLLELGGVRVGTRPTRRGYCANMVKA